MEPLFNFVHCDGLNSDDESTNFSKRLARITGKGNN